MRKKIIADKKKYNDQQLADLKRIDKDIRNYKGKLDWPVQGKVIKSFGPHSLRPSPEIYFSNVNLVLLFL